MLQLSNLQMILKQNYITTKKKKLKDLLHEKSDLCNSKNPGEDKILWSYPFFLLG